MAFEEHVHARVRAAIAAIERAIAADIYALSFYAWGENDDPRRIRLTVTYNTEARARACTPTPGQKPDWPIASDASEARWNYAFWLQTEGEVCEIGADEADVAARATWVASSKLGWTDEEEASDFETTIDRGEALFAELEGLAVSVAKRLHAEKIIIRTFGRPIPILIHDLEYDPRFAALTSEANPRGLASDFVKWVEGD